MREKHLYGGVYHGQRDVPLVFCRGDLVRVIVITWLGASSTINIFNCLRGSTCLTSVVVAPTLELVVRRSCVVHAGRRADGRNPLYN